MVYPVQSPQERHGVHHDVLKPDHEVHDDHRGRHGNPEWDLEVVQQPPAPAGGKGRRTHRRGREQKTQQQGIECHQPDIVRPAHGLGDRQRPAWGQHLPWGHDGEDGEKKTETDGGRVRLYEWVQGRAPPVPGRVPPGRRDGYTGNCHTCHSTDWLNV